MKTLLVFSNDIGVEFEVEKYAVLTMKKRKMANRDRTALSKKKIMKGLKEGYSYKCLEVIQADGTKHHEMKEKVKTEYYR